MLPWRILALLPCCLLAAAEGQRDWIIFEEDDPLGHRYYDASYGQSRQRASLKLSSTLGQKLPILPGGGAEQSDSALLEWAGKDWEMFVYAPGFVITDARPFEQLVMLVNGPAAIPKEILPRIQLQDGADVKSDTVQVGQFLPSLDADTNTWQEVVIPLKKFGEKFDLGRFRNVIFSGIQADPQRRSLWIDRMRLVDKEFIAPKNPPPAPTQLITRAGDRTVSLAWAAGGREGLGCNVYRAEEGERKKVKLNERPITIQSFADVEVRNDRSYLYEVRAFNEAGESESATGTATPREFEGDEEFLEYLQATAFNYFWYEANPKNGLIRDRSEPFSPASIAAVGFGLTAIGIGIDHGWITREQGRERALATLNFLEEAPQGTNRTGMAGYKGWFYHFLDMESGTRFGSSELSSIDTALMMLGVLYAREYFDGAHLQEKRIREVADALFGRIDWRFMLNGGLKLSHGWHPERGFISSRWSGYDEGSFLYLLGLGAAESNRLPPESWREWTSTYKWETHHGFSFVRFAPLFGHQYTACWIDLRYIQDDYMRGKGITYFENSRRATLAQRAYCSANPGGFPGYGPNLWGLTACDGPGLEGAFGYRARGAPPAEHDDGTLAPTAPGGSLPFAPEHCVAALREMYERHREKIWHGYGFRDAFNLKLDWWGPDVIGIDQGPILLMAENLRSSRVWNVMKKNEVIQRGLERAGFKSRVGSGR